MNKKKDIEMLVKDGYPIIYIETIEENRTIKFLVEISKEIKSKAYSWSINNGLESLLDETHFSDILRDTIKVLEHIRKSKEKSLYILKDFHNYIHDNRVKRKIRDIIDDISSKGNVIIILGPENEIPKELKRIIKLMEFPLPTYEDLENLLDEVTKKNNKLKYKKETIINAVKGLTLTEAKDIFKKLCPLSNDNLTSCFNEYILHSKMQLIKKHPFLEYCKYNVKFDDIGGLEILKEWLKKWQKSFSKDAQSFSIKSPKGVLLTGVYGCGKSLCIKALPSLWNIPLIRLELRAISNISSISFEKNFKKVIKTVENLSPCILWIDEITGLSNADQNMSRSLNLLLRWMKEKNKPVFIAMTTGDIFSLPKEFLRKGIFNEVFFLGLPSKKERLEIIKILLTQKNRDPYKFGLESILEVSKNFSGIEIEEGINSALLEAYNQNREIITDDILKAFERIYPFSRTAKDEISKLILWAEHQAVFASKPYKS